jgi:tRNA threonylcarbamoyladenosine biosynthesis protein TsaB
MVLAKTPVILGIDTTGQAQSIAIDIDGKISEFSLGVNLSHEKNLILLIDSLLKFSEIKKEEIDYFAIAIGPGSFTGLRIGLATVKGLSFALDKPIVPVSSLKALALNINNLDYFICPIIDARNGYFYNALYKYTQNGKLRTIIKPKASLIQDLNKIIKDKTIFVGDVDKYSMNKIKRLLKNNAMFSPNCSNAKNVCILARDMIKKRHFITGEKRAFLEPEYLCLTRFKKII